MFALGIMFMYLPAAAIISFTCFAAFRAQRHKAFKILAYAFLTLGLLCGGTPVTFLLWPELLT
ncbi:hypothetical protein [Streptomyces sp. NPDC042319]|uniref:hypothetical protein n=1 Tax=Streptomyces sp. NPDC042319 TaxID=3154332 RepID=UPI0033DC589B